MFSLYKSSASWLYLKKAKARSTCTRECHHRCQIDVNDPDNVVLGSIAALCMALGLDGKQVEKELSALALDKILYQDSRGSGGQLSKLSSGLSFLNSLGVHDGTEVSHASKDCRRDISFQRCRIYSLGPSVAGRYG